MFPRLRLCLVQVFIIVLPFCSVHGLTSTMNGRQMGNNSTQLGTSQIVNGVQLTIPSPAILTYMGMDTVLYINYSINCEDAVSDDYIIAFSVTSEQVVVLKTNSRRIIRGVLEDCRSQENVTGILNVTLSGVLIGRAMLLGMAFPLTSSLDATADLVMKYDKNPNRPISHLSASPPIVTNGEEMLNSTGQQPARFLIITMRKLTKLDTVFNAVMLVTLICMTTAMGCKTEMRVLKEVWRRPVAPGIGLFCQFVAMPLIAFTLTRIITFPSTAMAIGFFACGCAPGGGVSNFYAYILGGDVSLSCAMTAISNLVAIGTFPMWIFTLGRVILAEDENLKIPYVNILISLLMIALPMAFGIFIAYKFPNFTKKLLKFLIPIAVVLIVVLSALMIYLNLYVFQMIKPVLFLAGALLPYLGYICGMVLALIFKQSWKFTKTIAIETGVQNVGIAFITVMFSFPPPDGFIAAIAPMASSMMTPIPLLILAAIYHIYLRCFKGKKEINSSDKNDNIKKQKGNTVQQNGSAKEKEAMIDRISTV